MAPPCSGPESAAIAADGGDERVGVRTADGAHRAGAAVLFVIGVQDEEHLERARQHRVGGVLRLGALPQHVHVVLGVAQLRVGGDVGQAQAMAVGVGRQGGHLADQPDDLFIPGFGIAGVLGLGIERGERRDGGDQDAHRVGIVVEAVHELLHVLVGHGVAHDFALPVFQLFRRGQLAVQQQVGDFQEAALLGQLFDRVAAIAQDALVAVQIGDRALAGGRIHERRIVGHQTEIVRPGFDLPQIHGADGAAVDRDGVCLLGTVVGNREGFVVRHAILLELQAATCTLDSTPKCLKSPLIVENLGDFRPL